MAEAPHGARDASELLDIEVQELPGVLALVAHERIRRRERLEAIEPEPPEGPHHRGEREPELARDPHAGPAPAPELLDPTPWCAAECPRAAMRAARAIGEPGVPFLVPPGHPLLHGAHAHPHVSRDRGGRFSADHHALDKEGSPARREDRILVDVH
jgi:hypothetical protein